MTWMNPVPKSEVYSINGITRNNLVGSQELWRQYAGSERRCKEAEAMNMAHNQKNGPCGHSVEPEA